MATKGIYDDYIARYPILDKVAFSMHEKVVGEKLHPLLVLTQYIIDTLIVKGEKRIAIVLPDNDCNIIPLIISKYFSNILYEEKYAGNVLTDIKPGQRLRLGKAVVEFVGYDAQGRIGLLIGTEPQNYRGPFPSTLWSPVTAIHALLEKCDGARSSEKAWQEAVSTAKKKHNLSDTKYLSIIKSKRTVINKTILLLSAKNVFKDFIDDLYINSTCSQDVMTCGEIDIDSDSGFKLYGKGKLDCIPALTVSVRLDEIFTILKKPNIKEKVFAICSTADKFDELIGNPDTFKRCLRLGIPFITFVPENSFELYPILSGYGFKMWHWKPSTMQSDILLNAAPNIYNGIFGNLSEKVNHAALAEFKTITCRNEGLRKCLKCIRLLSQLTVDSDNDMHKTVRLIWSFYSRLMSLICEIDDSIYKLLSDELTELVNEWRKIEKYYNGQQLASVVNEILQFFEFFITNRLCVKCDKLIDYLNNISKDKKTTIILPDKAVFFEQTAAYLSKKISSNSVRLLRLSDFYTTQEKYFCEIDNLIVTWFEKDEYIRIKQTYCYDNLIYLLYDFENKWREGFVNKFDDCLPHNAVKESAALINLEDMCFANKPIDALSEQENDEENSEISDYNFSKNIVRSTISGSSASADSADSIECIPMILSGDNIAYFYPSHSVIDVTGLLSDGINRPLRKDSSKLRKGDKILIRLSGKDIIKEKADVLMDREGKKSLRDSAEIWSQLLGLYANEKSITNVCDALNKAGADCSFQQVRYWLSGETIMPRDKNVLIAIGVISSNDKDLSALCDDYLDSVDKIYAAGREVQSYHQIAGRRLSNELKNKASDIYKIALNPLHRGMVAGIGEICVYSVEEIMEKAFIQRGKLNRVEAL